MNITRITLMFLLIQTALGFEGFSQHKPVIVVHGGAGTILKSQMTPDLEKRYTAAIEEALKKGYEILNAGGSSLDAVQAAVMVLEDNPLFNAGKGAVFTNEGKNELDAAIMSGKNLRAGSIAGVTTIRNPITAARAVMDKSGHVMMVGPGAEKFAAMNGIKMVDPSYFHTDNRWRSLQRMRREDSLKTELDHADTGRKTSAFLHPQYADPSDQNWKYGTVGAVALDKEGNLAAATSTGGMSNKKYGRVGDAPLIGIGTYANNATCAISCTGWGEYFIRLGMALSISDMMEYGKRTLQQSADEMVMKRLPALGKTENVVSDGGLVAVDKDGNISMTFNSAGMYRGYIDKDGKLVVKIYKD